MRILINQYENSRVAILEGSGNIISDQQTAMDLLADVSYNYDCHKILIQKENICPEFFDLSTCLAGDILQKYTTYNMKIAIVGDFSDAGKSLASFIYECNKGRQVFFAASQQIALKQLHACE